MYTYNHLLDSQTPAILPTEVIPEHQAVFLLLNSRLPLAICFTRGSVGRTVWKLLKKLGIKPPYHSAIPLLGICTEEIKTEKDTCTPMFTAALFTIAKT